MNFQKALQRSVVASDAYILGSPLLFRSLQVCRFEVIQLLKMVYGHIEIHMQNLKTIGRLYDDEMIINGGLESAPNSIRQGR
jgi:hypothetical protein